MHKCFELLDDSSKDGSFGSMSACGSSGPSLNPGRENFKTQRSITNRHMVTEHSNAVLGM